MPKHNNLYLPGHRYTDYTNYIPRTWFRHNLQNICKETRVRLTPTDHYYASLADIGKPRVERIAQAIAEQIESQHREHDGKTRNKD